MRKLLSFFILLIAFCFAGCFDTQENVTINADGSGTYVSTINMSGMFDMMQMAAAMDTSANSNEMKNLIGKDVDSLISLKSITDTATNLTADEKQLLRNATMRFVISEKDKLFKITLTYPFKKPEDVQKIMTLMQNGKAGSPLGNKKENAELGMGRNGLPEADFFNVVYQKGIIERKVDEAKLLEFKNKEELKSIGQMESMYTDITFSTSIKLPGNVKKVQGERVKVSEDKRTVTIKYNLMDMIKNPKALEYRIEY